MSESSNPQVIEAKPEPQSSRSIMEDSTAHATQVSGVATAVPPTRPGSIPKQRVVRQLLRKDYSSVERPVSL